MSTACADIEAIDATHAVAAADHNLLNLCFTGDLLG
jgi:hypothetical protein